MDKKTFKVRILSDTGCFLNKNTKLYTYMPQLFEYFFPDCFHYKVVLIEEPADICIFSVCLNDKTLLRDNEINILISIENISYWNWYAHYTKYGDYGNDKVDIFMYNHKFKVEKTAKYLTIPTAIQRIEYFKKTENKISFKETKFQDKKFAFIINSSSLNNNMINRCKNFLSNYGDIDVINNYSERLKDVGIYNTPKFLEMFNEYKFIICIENSCSNGYITEKIFNCYHAKTIPIYNGCEIAPHYFNKKSYINANCIESYGSLIENLRDNEERYNSFVSQNKISEFYTDQSANTLLIEKLTAGK